MNSSDVPTHVRYDRKFVLLLLISQRQCPAGDDAESILHHIRHAKGNQERSASQLLSELAKLKDDGLT